MAWLRDLVYLLAAIVMAPVWAWRAISRGKNRGDWAARFGRTHLRPTDRPTVLIHGVSVGEVNAIRLLVRELEQRYRDDVRLVISATTDTGIARARQLYETRHEVVRYPFDFSLAVRRFLRSIQPDLVALVELEVWPNFSAACGQRGIDLIVINGRLSDRSFRGYRRFRPLVRSMFARLTRACVQDEAYARRFAELGTLPQRIDVAGTMKWDNARITDSVEGTAALAQAMGIDRDRPLVVCGSSGPGEETLFREHLADLIDGDGRPVQLLVAPRKPERFDEAAEALGQPIRRTTCPDGTVRQPGQGDVFLLDTLGELAKAYGLADVAVVGRSFCPLYGSDMTEPIALGRPTVIGPNTSDFADMMAKLLAGDGIVQVADGQALREAVEHLLSDPVRAGQLASNGRAVIRANQGATMRHAQVIADLLGRR